MFYKGTYLALGLALVANTTLANIDEIITVATRAEANLTEVIGTVSVLDESALKLVSHAHVQQALSRVAGVNLHRGNGQEYLPAMRSPVLTGAGGCGGFLMQEDGIPLRAAGFCNINQLFEANTEMAQRIEVLRGTGTVLHGSNAMHGVINIVTPASSDDSKAALEIGADDYRRLKYQSTLGAVGVAANFTHDGGFRDQSGFDQQKISLRNTYNNANLQVDSGLTLTNLNQETAGFIEGRDAYTDSAAIRQNLNPEAYRDVSSMRVWSRISQSKQHYQLVMTPYIRFSQMDFLQHFLPGDPLEENGQKSIGVQVGYYRTLRQGLNVIAGVDAEITDAYLKQSQDKPTQGSPFLQETIPQGQHYDYQVDAIVAAPFMHLDWAVSDELSVSGGLRFESMRYDYHNNMLSGRTKADGTVCGRGGCRYSRPPSGTDEFDNWSANLGAKLVLNDNNNVFIRLARGFRAPQATELYRLQRKQQITDLESESIESVELGLNGSINGLRYELAAYHMEKDNVIFRDSDFFNVSDGNTEHQGVELALDYVINAQWSVAVSATQAKHTYLDSASSGDINIRNNDIDTAPRHFGNARLAWRPSDHSRVELEWQSMGRYFLEPENLHRYEGHNIVNVRASWALSDSHRIYANISNLTDRDYAERADWTKYSEKKYRYFPGLPRAVQLGVELSW
jgi:outer membrane receptor protein involved in Fe transport